MSKETRALMITKDEAELIVDSFKVSASPTRALAMKVMRMVVEWDSEQAGAPAVREAGRIVVQGSEGPS